MIPGRLRQCLKILRWEPADLADELGRRECAVKAWIEGHAPASLAVAAWIEALAKAHETLAPPGRISTASKPFRRRRIRRANFWPTRWNVGVR